MVDDGCITEEFYNSGLFDSCFGELVNQLTTCSVHFYWYHVLIIVEILQVGFSESTVTVDEDAGMVTLTIEINQNSWVTTPITVTYSTLEVVGATNAASKLYVCD